MLLNFLLRNIMARLTEEQKRELRRLTLGGWTDSALADHFKLTPLTIAGYRKKMGLVKDVANNTIIENGVVHKIEAIAKPNLNELTTEEKTLHLLAQWQEHFKKTNKYRRLSKQYTATDLEYFAEQWAYYHVQFENLTQTEEDSIDLLIDYKIRIENNRKQYRDIEMHEEEVREKLGNKVNEELDLEDEDTRYLYEMMTSINKNRLDINKDLKELTEKYEKIQRSLNATREQREQHTRIGGDTFLSLVKMMNDEEKRKKIGEWNERFKLSTRQKLDRLKQDHQFDDGVVEPLIMDGADYKDKILHAKSIDSGNSGADGPVSGGPSKQE